MLRSPVAYLSLLVPAPSCFNYGSFAISPMLGGASPLSLFFLFKIFLVILDNLCFHINIRIKGFTV